MRQEDCKLEECSQTWKDVGRRKIGSSAGASDQDGWGQAGERNVGNYGVITTTVS